ncbi:hypothetical protein K438DRAFT_1786679 [Mycena galopus ATCC 62051]|nr:hypothetical protein K438DRAFT_1786679 [Mycena galopus ATCC 62051]
MYIKRVRVELKGRKERQEWSAHQKARRGQRKDSCSAEKPTATPMGNKPKNATKDQDTPMQGSQGSAKAALHLVVGKESGIKIIAIPSPHRLDATFAVGGVQNALRILRETAERRTSPKSEYYTGAKQETANVAINGRENAREDREGGEREKA